MQFAQVHSQNANSGADYVVEGSNDIEGGKGNYKREFSAELSRLQSLETSFGPQTRSRILNGSQTLALTCLRYVHK